MSLKKETLLTLNDSFIQRSVCEISSRENPPQPDTLKIDQNSKSNSIQNSLQNQNLQYSLSFSKRKQSKMQTESLKIFQQKRLNSYLIQDSSIHQHLSLNQKKEPRRLMKAINLLVNVIGFYRKLSRNTRLFSKLSFSQFRTIGDYSSNFNQKGQFFYKNSFMTDLSRIFKLQINNFQKIPKFSPFSFQKSMWDLLQAFLIIFLSFIISIYFFFGLDLKQYQYYISSSSLLFLIDILIKFNTGIVKKGTIVYQQKIIASKYLKNTFLYDFVGLLSLIYFKNKNVQNDQTQYFMILFFIKLRVLKEIGQTIYNFFGFKNNMKSIIDLVKLVFLIAFVCHVFSLFWYGLAETEIKYGRADTWLNSKNIVEEGPWVKYVYSFYFLSITMITVGYGDIIPQNYIEAIFTVVIMFTTAIFWAFFLGKVGKIINTMAKQDKLLNKNMGIIHQMMREEKVDLSLRIKISNYLSYFYKEFDEVQKRQEKSIISKLSQQLQDQLILSVQGKYLKQIPFFEKLKSKKEVALAMEEVIFSPEEYIYQKNIIDDCSLYIIVKGQVDLVFTSENRGESKIKALDKLKYFGEQSFISGFQRELSAKAATFCRVYKISRKKFIQAVSQSDFDQESFQMLQDALFLKSNYKFCNIRCQICQSYQHLPQYCPKTHFVSSKQALISRHNSSSNHLERMQFDRKKFKFQSLKYSKSCFQAIYLINDNENFFECLNNIEDLIFSPNDITVSDLEYEQDQNFGKEDKDDYNESKKQLNKLFNSSKQNFLSKMTHQGTLENFITQQTYQQSNYQPQYSDIIEEQDEKQQEQENDQPSLRFSSKSLSFSNQINKLQKQNSEVQTQVNSFKNQQNIKNIINTNSQGNSQSKEENIVKEKNIRQVSPSSDLTFQSSSINQQTDSDVRSQFQQSNLESQGSLKSKFPSRLIQNNNNNDRKQNSFTSFKEATNKIQKRYSQLESLESLYSNSHDYYKMQQNSQEKDLQSFKNNNHHQHSQQYQSINKLRQTANQKPPSLQNMMSKNISSSLLQYITQSDILNNSKIPSPNNQLIQNIQKQNQMSIGSDISFLPIFTLNKLRFDNQDKEQFQIDQQNNQEETHKKKQNHENNLIQEYDNNYILLQYFEKAHIFKYYNPLSNYDVIVNECQRIFFNNQKQKHQIHKADRKKSKFINLLKN